MNKAKRKCNAPGCHELTNNSYCEKHKRESVKIKNSKYDKLNRNKKAKEFYNSSEWINTSNRVLNNYKGLDLYAYYVENKIVFANTAHHIIELMDDWDKRLDINNLFPVSSSSHKKIHLLYLENKKETQEMLFSLLDKFKKEFIG